MQWILAFGNKMNGTSKRGGAWGFQFENIMKACTTKTTDNKSNIVMECIDMIE